MKIVLLARIFAFILFSFFSFVIHYFLFSNSDDTYFDAMTSHIYMYILYFIISLLVAEHLLNYIKRKKD
jgi:hypothetical protein